MTNKARRVSLPEYPEGFFAGREDPNGDHMLVPVEVWERVVEHISNDECYCFELSGGICHRCGLMKEIGGSND